MCPNHSSMLPAERVLKPYPAYRESGVEWLGDVPEHWEVTAVKTKYAIQLGKMLQNGPHKSTDVEVPYLKAQHVQWFSVRTADVPKMWASQKDRTQFGIRPGDLLVCEGGEGGRCAIAPEDVVGHIIQNALHRVRPREPKQSRNDFLLYTLSTLADIGWLDSLNNKATIAHFTKEKFGALNVLIPPFSEQTAIVRFLDHANRRIRRYIRAREKLIALLEEQKQAIIHQAITGQIDVRTGQPYPTCKPSGVEWLGDVPEHWGIGHLRHFVTCLDGQRVPLNSIERGSKQGDIPYYGANRIIDYIDDWLFDEPLVLLGEDGAPFFENNRDVAFFISGKTWVNNHAHVLRCGYHIIPKFLPHILNITDYTFFVDGSTRDKLTQQSMGGIPIQIPPIPEQVAIVEYLDKATANIGVALTRTRRQIELLREYRTCLIADVVTGKLDVREAAAQLPDEGDDEELLEEDSSSADDMDQDDYSDVETADEVTA